MIASSGSISADGNRHGIYNGQNLDGFDIGRLYLEVAKNSRLLRTAGSEIRPYHQFDPVEEWDGTEGVHP